MKKFQSKSAQQIIGFLISGVFAAVTEITVFAWLAWMGLDPVVANLFSVVAAILVAFVGNHFFAFRSNESRSTTKTLPMFAVVGVVSLLVSSWLISVAVDSWGVDSVVTLTIIKAVIIGGMATIRFFIYKFVIFR